MSIELNFSDEVKPLIADLKKKFGVNSTKQLIEVLIFFGAICIDEADENSVFTFLKKDGEKMSLTMNHQIATYREMQKNQ